MSMERSHAGTFWNGRTTGTKMVFSMIVRESKNLKTLFRFLLDQDLRTSNLGCLNT